MLVIVRTKKCFSFAAGDAQSSKPSGTQSALHHRQGPPPQARQLALQRSSSILISCKTTDFRRWPALQRPQEQAVPSPL